MFKGHLVKRYGNRKLYSITESRYITLPEIAEKFLDCSGFIIKDLKTDEDLTVEYLVKNGVPKDEAIRRATKQAGTFAEALSKHSVGGTILSGGFALAAEEFYGSKYKGDQATDGSMAVGEVAEIDDGVYTDKENKIIFTVKDKKVVQSRNY